MARENFLLALFILPISDSPLLGARRHHFTSQSLDIMRKLNLLWFTILAHEPEISDFSPERVLIFSLKKVNFPSMRVC